MESSTTKKELETLVNKDIETKLMEMYIREWITKEELIKRLDELEKKDMPKPPKIY